VSDDPAIDVSMFSPREIEVLRNLAVGRTNATTARRMNISVHTVDTYIRRIKDKVGPLNRGQLVILAVGVSS
jgi:DNA-binding CsgD family transcriptional regulator